MTRPTPARPARRPGHPPAFTLLEVLIVVGILALLTSLLVVGIKHLTGSAKRQQTRATLAQCVAMYNDWQAVAHQPFAPTPMAALGDVTTDLASSPASFRYGPATWFTRDVMFHIRSVPANAAALGKLPPSAVMTLPAANNAAFPLAVSAWDLHASYTPFETGDYGRVYISDGLSPANYTHYECISFVPPAPAPGANPPPAIDPSHWLLAYPVFSNGGADADRRRRAGAAGRVGQPDRLRLRPLAGGRGRDGRLARRPAVLRLGRAGRELRQRRRQPVLVRAVTRPPMPPP